MRTWVRSHPVPVGAAIIAVATYLMFRHTLVRLDSHAQAEGGENGLYLFWMGHMPWALEHGHNPMITNQINFPGGLNATWNTSVLTPALVMAPVTMIFGVIVGYNLAVILGFAATVVACWWAVQRIVLAAWPALLGGLLAGLSPYMLTQTAGHLNLAIMVVPAILLGIGYEILVRQKVNPLIPGLAMGVLLAMQFGISTEILASCVLMSAIGVVVLALQHRKAITQDRVRWLVRPLVIGAGSCLILLTLPLYEVLHGPQRLTGPAQNADRFRADLLSFVIPTRHRLWAPTSLTDVSNNFSGNVNENTAYLGPLLLVMIVLAIAAWRSAIVRWSSVMTLISIVLSMGIGLRVNGHDTGVPLPFKLISHTPFLESAAAVRYSFYTMLFGGVLVAAGLQEILSRSTFPQPRLSWLRVSSACLVGLICVGALLPSKAIAPIASNPVSKPAWFDSAEAHSIPKGSVLLTFPYLSRFNSRPMAWEALSHFHFKQVGAYGITPDPNHGGQGRFDIPNVFSYVSAKAGQGTAVPTDQKYTTSTLKELAEHQVETIMILRSQPGAELVSAYYAAILQTPVTVHSDAFAFYDVRHKVSALEARR